MLQSIDLASSASQSPFLTDEQLSWLSKARRFADSVPLSDVLKSDAENIFRRDLFEDACKEGFGALPFPTTYGGCGGDYVSFCLINEEFAKRCLPVMSSLGVHILCQEPIYKFGDDKQKSKYLRAAASGKYLAAFALTEPQAGSDTAALATSATLVGDHYVLNGTKTFITSGGAADFYIVMARVTDKLSSTAPSGGGQSNQGISAFIVERRFEGFAVGQKFEMLGMRGYATCEIVMSDCLVPKENLLGMVGEGRKVALSSLAQGRVTIAAQATGWAQGALEGAAKILSSKNGQIDSLHHYHLGHMAMLVEASRTLTYQAAYKIDCGQSDYNLAAMAKVQATDAAMEISSQALSLCGEMGFQPGYLIERIFRDAKAGQIYEGTNQIQRMLMTRYLAGDEASS